MYSTNLVRLLNPLLPKAFGVSYEYKIVVSVIQEYKILFSDCTPKPCFFGEVQKWEKHI